MKKKIKEYLKELAEFALNNCKLSLEDVELLEFYDVKANNKPEACLKIFSQLQAPALLEYAMIAKGFKPGTTSVYRSKSGKYVVRMEFNNWFPEIDRNGSTQLNISWIFDVKKIGKKQYHVKLVDVSACAWHWHKGEIYAKVVYK